MLKFLQFPASEPHSWASGLPPAKFVRKIMQM